MSLNHAAPSVFLRASGWRRFCDNLTRASLCAIFGGLALLTPPLRAQQAESTKQTWSEKDTRLATEYLGMLMENPEPGRVLDLLWELYEKRGSSAFLLESIATQAASQQHPSVYLIHAHLLRKSGDREGATARYLDVLKLDAKNLHALRALKEIYAAQGEHEKALSYQKLLVESLPEKDPSRASLLVEQGRLLQKLEKPKEAAECWEAAVKLQPGNHVLLREIAQLLLGSGAGDKALVLYRQLAKDADPAKRLDALLDLARLEELGDHFAEAATALRDGMSILHYKDWRYAQFFQRYVMLHERFDELDQLRAELQKAAEARPPSEKALSDLARAAALMVDSDERIRWLRHLVREFPQTEEYRWELVTELLDHEGGSEAARLLDEKMKNDGTDAVNLVILRVLADMRQGMQKEAVGRLQRLLAVQGAQAEVEKQVLAFAREKSLDDVISDVLSARLQRDPDRAEYVFDLAAFLRARGLARKMEETFDVFVKRADPSQRQRRLNDVSSFLASGHDPVAAEKAAREAAAQPGAGREELLRLGDVLAENGNSVEALSLLEQAWRMSDTAETRTDVDERILSLLAGVQVTPRSKAVTPDRQGFQFPAILSGDGFGSDAPPAEPEDVADAVTLYAVGQAMKVRHLWPEMPPTQKLPPYLRPWVAHSYEQLLLTLPTPHRDLTMRAAWWVLRAEKIDLCYTLLRPLLMEAEKHTAESTVELDRLLLDLALLEKEKNPLLVIRQLRRLADKDPAHRTSYILRLAEQEAKWEQEARDTMLVQQADQSETGLKKAGANEKEGRPRGIEEAIHLLNELLKQDPQNEAVLSSLYHYYLVSDRKEDAMAIWTKASEMKGPNSVPLLERFGELLLGQRQFEQYVNVQVKLLEGESDVKRRRDIFKRGVERLLLADATQGELHEKERNKRLDIMLKLLLERASQQPFEAFWQEGLAGIYERRGDAAKAFAAMKQAYYMAPDTPFSLDQLRAAALKVGDMKAAIYFQKQIAATTGTREQAGEWRQLVQLLESDFRMSEADETRRRLEARFSQDPAALDELAKYYTDSGQDAEARRVLEQLTRVKGWDAKYLLQLALKQEAMGDKAAAMETLKKLLTTVPPPKLVEGTPPEKWSWPFLDERFTSAVSPSGVLNSLDNAPGLEERQRGALRSYMSLPRPEFSILPDEAVHIRLRAVELLAEWTGAPPDVPGMLEMERIWGDYYSGTWEPFRQTVRERLASSDSLEAQFAFVWLLIKAAGVNEILAWCQQEGLSEATAQERKALLQTVCNVLADDLAFSFQREEVVALGESRLFSRDELKDVWLKFVRNRRFDLALACLEASPSIQINRSPLDLLDMASFAEASGDTEREEAYIREAWSKPLISGGPNLKDPFIQSFAKLWRSSRGSAERDQLLAESWRRLHQVAPSGQGVLRDARILGIIGAGDVSAQKLSEFWGNGMVTDRAFAEPTLGRFPPGSLPGGPGLNQDHTNHLRSYWEDLKQWGEIVEGEGLARELSLAEAAVTQRNGGTALGTRPNYEFNTWRNQSLVRKMRMASYPERVRMLKEFTESDQDVQTLQELASALEYQGMSRESIEIYRSLPDRARTNNEYAEQLFRASETALDGTAAIPYLEDIIGAVPPNKPQGHSDETLREKHARFLALNHDVEKLRSLAFRRSPTPRSPRIPADVAYLKELAILLERHGDKPGALAAWEELYRVWKGDPDALLRRAKLLHALGNEAQALEALREMPLVGLWNGFMHDAVALRAQLALKADRWEEVRELMDAVTGGTVKRVPTAQDTSLFPFLQTPAQSRGKSTVYTGAVLALAQVLAEGGRPVEAQSLLLRAERTVKDAAERFRLRLAQLRLAVKSPHWTPESSAPLLASLLSASHDDREDLKALADFLEGESGSGRATGWVPVLKAQPVSALNALALGVFAPHLEAQDLSRLTQVWDKTPLKNLQARELLCLKLIDARRPEWAREVASVGAAPGLTRSPVMVAVLAALQDRHGLDELYFHLVRLPLPGGSDAAPFAEELVKAGRKDLATELYDLARARRLAMGGFRQPQLLTSHVRFLMSEQQYERAETLLLEESPGMTTGLAELLVDLYQKWNRLDQLPQELAKFHLPAGVYHEALFLGKERSTAP